MNNNMAEFSIREMKEEDIDAVLHIDKTCFSMPWTREIYEQEVTENQFAHYFVIEERQKIIGYIGIWIVLDDAQVTNIAILPDYRGYGIGENLFGYAVQFMIQQGAIRLSLEVRTSNIIAQKLYKKFGLRKGGVRKNYYPDNGEDAYVMWVNL